MKVLWLANIPSPYRVNFFNELGKQCDLTVLFERRTSSERDGSWSQFEASGFKAIFLPRIFNTGVAEAFCPSIKKYLVKGAYDHIFVTNYSDATGLYAISILKRRKIPYILESDGAFKGNGKGIKEKIKKWIISGADLCFSTGKIHDEYYSFYGCDKEKMVRYPFTSLYNKDILAKPIDLDQKIVIRQELGIKEKFIILSVGQFIYRKGFDILLNAIAGISSEVGCYIIGGTPTEEYIRLVKKNHLDNAHFLPFKLKDEIDKYYMASDLFVLPTREDIWGLVINEAMAKGLPVVTTSKCVAGLELISDQKNGKIVAENDIASLKKAIFEFINSNVCENESNYVLSTIRNYTFENMSKIHLEALKKYETIKAKK